MKVEVDGMMRSDADHGTEVVMDVRMTSSRPFHSKRLAQRFTPEASTTKAHSNNMTNILQMHFRRVADNGWRKLASVNSSGHVMVSWGKGQWLDER